MSIDHAFLKEKVAEFATQRADYEGLEKFLCETFKLACQRFGISAFVEGRTKSLSSFAEKVIRKQIKFKNDPNYDITDRCGVRVIARSHEDRLIVCDYIRKNFAVDDPNSLDVKSRLKVDQFGYLSVHYVVQIKTGCHSLEGLALANFSALEPEKLRAFKAEIQVRTILEHSWASSLHDRLYKVNIHVPISLQRDAAALASTIEVTEGRFSRLASAIDSYLGHYAAYMTRDTVTNEIAILSAIMGYEDDSEKKALLALKLGRFHTLIGNLDSAVREWEKRVQASSMVQPALQSELGWALCQLHRHELNHLDFLRGQELLEGVARKEPEETEPDVFARKVVRAEAAHRLAWSYSRINESELEARDWYRKAHAMNPGNPYHLASFLEYEVFCLRNDEFVEVMRELVKQAIETCHKHAEAGIELPRAFFAIARLNVLLKDFHAALAAYVAAVRIILQPNALCPTWVFEEEVDFLHRISAAHHLRVELDWINRLLRLAECVRQSHENEGCSTFHGADGQRMESFEQSIHGSKADDAKRKAECNLSSLVTGGADYIKKSGKTWVIIVAGGSGKMDPQEVHKYEPFLRMLLRSLDGLVCSGGTEGGIPGLTGEVAESLKNRNEKPFQLVGYIPKMLPADVVRDRRYDAVFVTSGNNFSELEAIQYWTDLIHAGMFPQDVLVLGINGGTISAFEYRLALALGARVCVIEGSGREADAILIDPDWKGDPNLTGLPFDLCESATIQGFLRPKLLSIPESVLDKAAEEVHLHFLQGNIFSDLDPVRTKYKNLRDDLKNSNRQQVLYAAQILSSEGYEVRQFSGAGEINSPSFTSDEVERMAELEHGRWNAERLMAGWRPTREKQRDVANKRNPYLVPWNKLDDTVKQYDRDAVRAFPRVLANAGLEIVRGKKVVAV